MPSRTVAGDGRRDAPDGPSPDVAQQPAEEYRVNRNRRQPVQASGETSRIEGRGLMNLRRPSVENRPYLELEPAPARQLQIGRQSQASIRFIGFDGPPVYRVARAAVLAIVTAARHADTPEQTIDQAPQPPQVGREVPPGAPANTAYRCERRRWWRVDHEHA